MFFYCLFSGDILRLRLESHRGPAGHGPRPQAGPDQAGDGLPPHLQGNNRGEDYAESQGEERGKWRTLLILHAPSSVRFSTQVSFVFIWFCFFMATLRIPKYKVLSNVLKLRFTIEEVIWRHFGTWRYLRVLNQNTGLGLIIIYIGTDSFYPLSHKQRMKQIKRLLWSSQWQGHIHVHQLMMAASSHFSDPFANTVRLWDICSYFFTH